MNISKHFKRSEFACTCGCGYDTVDKRTLEILEDVREHFGQPVVITSGCRCPKHNARVGGAPKSTHVQGRAADFRVHGITAQQVYDYLDEKYPYELGLGLYPTWVHVDTRTDCPARW